MNISVTMDGEKKTFGFKTRNIIHEFLTKEEPEDQLAYTGIKLAEIALINGIGKKNIDIFSRFKRAYLVHCKHLDYILYGLHNMALDNLRVLQQV